MKNKYSLEYGKVNWLKYFGYNIQIVGYFSVISYFRKYFRCLWNKIIFERKMLFITI